MDASKKSGTPTVNNNAIDLSENKYAFFPWLGVKRSEAFSISVDFGLASWTF
jgi:hypothetical protein